MMNAYQPTHLKVDHQAKRMIPAPAFLIQRKCACGRTSGMDGECGECRNKSLQRQAVRSSVPARVPPIVDQVLHAVGQPLDGATRAFMEPRFGHDFSQVRVHTDGRAAESAQAVNALAYTVGHNIVFGAGHYTPKTKEGQKLIGHELTHVVQQQGSRNKGDQPVQVGAPDSTAEQEAASQAAAITEEPLSAKSPLVRTEGGLLQRQPLGSDPGGMNKGSLDEDSSLLMESFRQSITLDNFDLDQASLKPEHEDKLKAFKERFQLLLGRYPDSFISVIGHTDATGTEAHNKTLGQERADAVKNLLTSGDSALTAEMISAGSLGESMPAVETKNRQARNRRVEVIPHLRRFFKLPLPQPSVPLPGFSGGSSEPSKKPDNFGIGPLPPIPKGPAKIPDLKLPPRNWFEDALKRDPIVKSLPDWMRDKVTDALKDGDEMLAEKVIDALPLEAKTKAVVQAVVKSILQLAKGKKFEMPTPSPYEMPPSIAPEFPKMPGEVIIPGPTFRF